MATSNLGSSELFQGLLQEILTSEGFIHISTELRLHKYSSVYKFIHLDYSKQSTESIINFTGLQVGPVLVCYGFITESSIDKPINPIRYALALKNTQNQISENFRSHFVYPIKNILSPGIHGLPPELKFCILRYLRLKDVVAFSLVNKEWNNRINDNLVWLKIYNRLFNRLAFLTRVDRNVLPIVDTDWKEEVKNRISRCKKRGKQFERGLRGRHANRPRTAATFFSNFNRYHW